MKISLCLLVWNELEGCKIDVPHLPRKQFDEVYAIDGGSNDGTVGYLTSQGIPVYRQKLKGLNAAYISAVEHSTCDAVVVFFPKGNIDPLSLLRFRPLLERNNDLVIASRTMKGGRNEEDNKFFKIRKWGVLCLSFIADLMWRTEGHAIRDILHGYKGFTIAAFKRINPLDHGLSIDLEMAIRSYRLHLKRTEFPVSEGARRFGSTKFKILPTGIQLLKYLWYAIRDKNAEK